jgi:hypothetical protein
MELKQEEPVTPHKIQTSCGPTARLSGRSLTIQISTASNFAVAARRIGPELMLPPVMPGSARGTAFLYPGRGAQKLVVAARLSVAM